MKVLIVRKPTNFEQHGTVVEAQVKKGYLDAGSIDFLRKAHDEHYQCLASFRDLLDANDISFVEISRGDSWPALDDITAIASVGGDGTLLSASHYVETDLPIVGIRSSSSSVGYLCAGGIDELDRIVKGLKENSLHYTGASRLRAKVFRAEQGKEHLTFPVLNDFLFCNANPAATTRYRITTGSDSELQKSSGIWVSTPVGSTAGILAAGGIEMNKRDTRYQFVVRELYQSDGREYKIKSGIFELPQESLVIENRSGHAILALDGERGVLDLAYGDKITFLDVPPVLVADPV